MIQRLSWQSETRMYACVCHDSSWRAVAAGVRTVMISFNSVNGRQMHAHGDLIRGVLKGELGFEGLIVSDWGGHSDLREGADSKEKLALAVNAGIDLIMVPEHYEVRWAGHWITRTCGKTRTKSACSIVCLASAPPCTAHTTHP